MGDLIDLWTRKAIDQGVEVPPVLEVTMDQPEDVVVEAFIETYLLEFNSACIDLNDADTVEGLTACVEKIKSLVSEWPTSG